MRRKNYDIIHLLRRNCIYDSKGVTEKIKNLIISRPKDKLKKVSTNTAMEDIVEANLFEKRRVQLYKDRRDAYYKTRRVDVFL